MQLIRKIMQLAKNVELMSEGNVREASKCKMSRIVGKPDFCLCKNKGAVTAKLISAFVLASQIVQLLFFLNPKFQLACFCDCAGRFVSDLVGNPEDWFSRVAAQISPLYNFI